MHADVVAEVEQAAPARTPSPSTSCAEVELDPPLASSRCANVVLPCARSATRRPATAHLGTVARPWHRRRQRQRRGGQVACGRSRRRRAGPRRRRAVELGPARLLDERAAESSVTPRSPPALLQVRLDELVELAVHHPLDIGDLELRAVVVDHRVGLEDVRSDLVAAGVVGLGGLERPPCAASCSSSFCW